MTPEVQTRDVISFGPFSLVAGERLLTRSGAPVELGARAFDVLIALVSRPNEVVSKKDLLDRVWPDVTVEESSLRFALAGLRKNRGQIKHRRGFAFTHARADDNNTVEVFVLAGEQDICAQHTIGFSV